jgi:Domain of unknown function (DUF4192)
MTELMDIELNELVSLVSEIDYENGDFQLLQRAGALAFNDLVEEFTRTGSCKNKALLALVFVRLADLQVRDYAMGFTTTENIETISSMWRWLLEIVPSGHVAPVAALYSAICYERGDGELAVNTLDKAFADQNSYPLALLLRRVYAANWPPQSFAAMRKDLHPKVCAALFSE